MVVMHKKFPAALSHLKEMVAFVQTFAQELGFSSLPLSKIELATEEVLVNIVSYGYPSGEGVIIIHCSSLPSKTLQVEVIDYGIPFNPLVQVDVAKVKENLDQPHAGGYGIFFILEIMDKVSYRRQGECNHLILIKHFEV